MATARSGLGSDVLKSIAFEGIKLLVSGQLREITNFADVVRRAPFVLSGTIEKLNAATMSAVTATESTAILKVDEVLRAPPTLGNLKGKKITIQLASAKNIKPGQKATFYATSWMYGDSLAVVELAREADGRSRGALAALRSRVAKAELALEDQKLQERITRAELIVTGRVTRVAPDAEFEAKMPTSEHTPDWWRAQLEVDHVEKGKLREPALIVLYPNSQDEMWIDSPKFQEGLQGVWLLQRDQQEKGRRDMRVPGYTALDPLDFQPLTQFDRVRALTKRARG